MRFAKSLISPEDYKVGWLSFKTWDLSIVSPSTSLHQGCRVTFIYLVWLLQGPVLRTRQSVSKLPRRPKARVQMERGSRVSQKYQKVEISISMRWTPGQQHEVNIGDYYRNGTSSPWFYLFRSIGWMATVYKCNISSTYNNLSALIKVYTKKEKSGDILQRAIFLLPRCLTFCMWDNRCWT